MLELMAKPRDGQGQVPPAWVSWQVYVDRIFEEKEKALAVAFRGAQENLQILAKSGADALELAAQGVKEKLIELNNLRREYTEDRSKLVSLEKYEGDRSADLKRITALENFQNRLIGMGLILALVAGTVGAIVAKILHL